MAGHPRVTSVDLLRGAVMVVMALDHTRDFVNAQAQAFRPEDLTQTTTAIFMTRWVTHFCAPVFMLCAGLGAFLRLDRTGGRIGDLSRFLWTRGLWLVVLEITVVRIGFFFDVDYSGLIILLVFWALGVSMIVLAALVWLPWRVVAVISVGMILLHNLLDPVRATSLGSMTWLWRILHEPGLLAPPPPLIVVGYPVIPWIGVMAAGFCLGRVYRTNRMEAGSLDPAKRARFLIRLGLSLTLAFLIIRAVNIYGDPSRWSDQATPLFTALSFLNTTKYPPSLLFLLMTLGPAIAVLGWIDRLRVGDTNPLIVFGRVPLFYFVVHLPLIHAIQILMTWTTYGAAPFLFLPPPTLGTDLKMFPADFGWSLGVTYLVWIAVVLLMYPICLWFARLKARKRVWWLSYL
jgi:uncharacterized membrane protein